MHLNRRGRQGAVIVSLAIAGLAWAGCSGKKATEFVAGISSQVEVPQDLQTVVVTVNVGGVETFNQTYPVYDNKVRLPRTLGVVKGTTAPGTPITITVAGYSVPASASYGAFSDTGDPQVGTVEAPIDQGGGARILRRSRQPYVDNRILYVPMPLHFSCYDVDCGQIATASDPTLSKLCSDNTCTCKAGLCVAPDTDPTQLPDYTDDLVYGTTNTCFRPFSDKDANGNPQAGCMDWGIGPQVLDAQNCIFALPDTASVPADAGPYDPAIPLPYVTLADQGGGLNVRAVYDNSSSEVLDYEGACPSATTPPSGGGTAAAGPQEGYCAFPGAPQRFQLAPGLCAMYRGDPAAPHVITLLEASAACPPKTAFQPVCDDSIQGPPQPNLADGGYASNGLCGAGGFALTPAPSALYVLFDTSTGMRDFVGNAGAAQALSLSLQDPVFKETLVGMRFMPAASTDCAGSGANNSFSNPTSLDVPFEDSFKAQADIATRLEATGPGDGGDGNLPADNVPWYLEAALEGAYSALGKLPNQGTYNRRAVMLFFDRDFNVSPPDCPAPQLSAITLAANALAQQQIETYVVFLANADYPDGGIPGNPITDATNLAQGLAAGGQYFFNATNGANAASIAASALGNVVADMGSCVYLPSVRGIGPGQAAIGPDWTLTFADDAAGGALVNVVNAQSCLTDDAATNPVWVYDNQHIRLCQNTCERLVKSVEYNELIAAETSKVTGVVAPAGGVSVFANPPVLVCDGGSPSDAAIVESGSEPLNYDAGVGGAVDGGDGVPVDAGGP
jgi:hypothetical protein